MHQSSAATHMPLLVIDIAGRQLHTPVLSSRLRRGLPDPGPRVSPARSAAGLNRRGRRVSADFEPSCTSRPRVVADSANSDRPYVFLTLIPLLYRMDLASKKAHLDSKSWNIGYIERPSGRLTYYPANSAGRGDAGHDSVPGTLRAQKSNQCTFESFILIPRCQ